ncbi:MAG: DUF4476 domain-containing protein [Chitinophagaceae bacterium]|nr:DUF4476 domain-containing protein [Chitinophagaceae bacterium]MCB9045833.1 DUF4476 domain-containing protein [Chitinophagales bacterium]
MKQALHTILFVLLCTVLPGGLLANGFSYVYIQGDKTLPFYVKLEDQMLPRYGKNYNLIPQLAPGVINIQVLFQQNAYPAQKFSIVVPESGFRGFLLMKKGDAFTLYDIHQQFYLHAGNKPEDDKAPVANTAEAYVYKPRIESTPAPVANSTVARQSSGPRFMTNVELNNERTIQQEPAREVRESRRNEPQEEVSYSETGYGRQDEYTSPEPEGNSMAVTNSDCPEPVSEGDFEDLYKKVQDKNEKTKLKYLLSKMDGCYTSNQARILTEALSNDPEKYTFLKRVYPRITDQYNFPAHENLLSTEEWKSYFRLIISK